MNYIKTHKEAIQKIMMLLFLLISVIILKKELKQIDLNAVKDIINSKSIINFIAIIMLGIVAFNASFLYDFYISKNLGIKKKNIYEIAWICQSFSFFIGMFGLTGAYLRQELYRKEKISKDESIKIALTVTLSSMTGLFFISIIGIIPLYRMGKLIYILGILISLTIGITFIFADNIYGKFINKKNPYLKLLTKKKRINLCIISTIEWLVATFYFAVCVKFFDNEISIFTGALVYIISVIVGFLSMIPGGFGSFETSAIIFFGYFNISSTHILPALIIFRLGYYILPFIVGLGLLIKKKLRNKHNYYDYNYYKMVRKTLSLLVLIVSILLILSASTPAIVSRIKILKAIMPYNLIFFSKKITILLGIILGILSRGIYMGVRKTYYTTIVFSFLLSILFLLSGLDYEESIIISIIALLLISNKKAFGNPSPSINKKSIFKIVLYTIFLFAGYVIIYNVVNKIDFLNGRGRFTLFYLVENCFMVLSFIFIAIIISLSSIFTQKYYENAINLSDNDWNDFKDIRSKYKNSAYTHLFYMGDKNIFVNSEKNLFFIYKGYKNHIFVLGDPVGERRSLENSIDEFSNLLIEDDRILSFYQITPKYMEEFVESGFKFLKLGEDALINLEEFTMEGKDRKNIRHTFNKIEQKNLKFQIFKKPHSKDFLDELEEISNSWLAGKKEMGYSIGAFNRSFLNNCNIYTLVDDKGRVQAFANDLEIKNSDILTIDMMRFYRGREDSIMEMLLLSIIIWAKENSYKYFDLGIAPLSNVGIKNYSPFKEKLVHIAYNYGNRVYGFAGLRSYKEKFKPEWKSVYLAYREDGRLAEILFYLVKLCHNIDDESLYI